MDKDYAYDPLGRVLSVENNITQNLASTIGMGGNYKSRYHYDEFNRLASSTGFFNDHSTDVSDTANFTLAMQYNFAGGITQKSQSVNQLDPKFGYDLTYQYHATKVHQLDRIYNGFPTAGGPPAEMGFAYNASGSMRAIGVHKQDGIDTTERYTYNEHQHMTGYANYTTGQYAHYAYDHTSTWLSTSAGERVVKGTLSTSFASVNGQSGPLSLELDPLTLYVNPYFVSVFNSATPEVSKHYYMGTQRVATNLGSYIPSETDPGGGGG